MVDFSNRDEARRWFEQQPREVAVAMAARADLRILPLIVTGQPELPADFFGALVLSFFRVAAVVWVAGKFPAHRAKLYAAAHDAGVALQTIAADPYANFDTDRTIADLADAIHTITGEDAFPHAASVLVASTRAARAADDAYLRIAATDGVYAVGGGTAVSAEKAGYADTSFIEAGQPPAERAARAAELAGMQLWLEPIPIEIAEAWTRLKSVLLPRNEDWEVWTGWYEARLAGRPVDTDLEVARVTLPGKLWEQGPKAVNAEIRRLIDEARSKSEIPAEPIPPQGAGPHFVLGAAGPIAFASPAEIDAEGNNISRIRQLLPLVRRAADDLSGHLSPNAFPELSHDVADYRAAIADDTRIAWGTVFGLGVMLENASAAAERHIEDPMWPRLEDTPKTALDSLLTLHGPLILATAEGRELADDADRMRLTREEQAGKREDAQAVADALRNDREVIDPPAADLVGKATGTIGEGLHPERGTVFGLAVIKNITVVLVSAATVAAVGATVTGTLGPAAGAGATWIALESMKKSKVFLSAAETLGGEYDRLIRVAEDQADLARAQIVARLNALAPFRRFVLANEEPLRRIATNTSAMHWMLSYIDFIARANQPPADRFLAEGPEWEDDNFWTWQPGDSKPPSGRSGT